MQDLPIKQVSPMKIYCDNKEACDAANMIELNMLTLMGILSKRN